MDTGSIQEIFKEPTADELPGDLSGNKPVDDPELEKILRDNNSDVNDFINENIKEMISAVSDLLPGKWKLSEQETERFSKPTARIIDRYLPDILSGHIDESMLLFYLILYFKKRARRIKKEGPPKAGPEGSTDAGKTKKFKEIYNDEKLHLQKQEEKEADSVGDNNSKPAKPDQQNKKENGSHAGSNQETGDKNISERISEAGEGAKSAGSKPELDGASSNKRIERDEGREKEPTGSDPGSTADLQTEQQKIKRHNKRAGKKNKKSKRNNNSSANNTSK